MTDAPQRVAIEIPALAEHIAVLRAASSVIASRLNFSLDEIDDLRILIDEAASVLLSAGAQGVVRCEITAAESAIDFELFASLPKTKEPHGEGFAWSILQALATDVSMSQRGDQHVISVTRVGGQTLEPTS